MTHIQSQIYPNLVQIRHKFSKMPHVFEVGKFNLIWFFFSFRVNIYIQICQQFLCRIILSYCNSTYKWLAQFVLDCDFCFSQSGGDILHNDFLHHDYISENIAGIGWDVTVAQNGDAYLHMRTISSFQRSGFVTITLISQKSMCFALLFCVLCHLIKGQGQVA